MIKKNIILTLVLAFSSIFILGCTSNDSMMKDEDSMMKDEDSMMKDEDSMMKDEDSMMKDEDSMMKDEDSMMKDEDSMFVASGNVLAGDKTQYIEFNTVDYQKALDENKIILLNFYASWCPSCKQEQIQTLEAFNELENENIVGFRVNYKDSDTEEFETDLAKKFGIAYQHTKVILVNGEKVLKAPDSWDKNRYLDELNIY